jgi:diguanylate cyclase (GGDEF)-like protein/PAS domain S-box-containing protein
MVTSEQSFTSRLVDERWKQYLVLGLFLAVGYYLSLPLPPLRAIFYTLIGLSALGAILYKLVRQRSVDRVTWMWLGLGVLLYFLGDLTYNIYRFFLSTPRPFPSVADLFYLTSRIPLFIGLLRAAKTSLQRPNPFSLLDSFILATGMAMLWWTVLMAPEAYNSSISPIARFIGSAYPATDFLLLAGTVRLALASTKRAVYHYLLIGSVGALLVADVVYTILQLNNVYTVGTPLDIGWIIFYVLMGAAVLYPPLSEAPARLRTQAQERFWQRMRMVFLTGAALLLPVTLVLSGLLRHGRADGVLVALGTVLILLVVVRLYRLMEANIELQKQLARAKSDVLFRNIVERGHSGVSMFQPDLVATYHSPHLYQLADISDTETDFTGIVHPDDLRRFRRFWREILIPSDVIHMIEYRLRNPKGEWSDVESTVNNLMSDDWLHSIVVITRDITAQKEYERKLKRLAYTDPLTGLANRAALADDLAVCLAEAKKHGRLAGAMFLDLDNFGDINNTLGHTAGDSVLSQLAERISTQLYSGESMARFGGDEFVIVSPNLREPEDARLMHQRIAGLLERPFQLESYTLYVTASAGIALSDHASTSDHLLRNADLALHRAKSEGSSSMRVFTPSLLMEAERRHAMSEMLRDILYGNRGEETELELTFEPIVRLSDGIICGFEGTAVWQHPGFRNFDPDELNDIAGESNLLGELEMRTLRLTCETLSKWKPLLANLPVRASINISAASFTKPHFERVVYEILSSYHLSPACLAFEITEQTIIGHVTTAASTFEGLAEAGVHIVIDHFGRDFSSISHLQRIPHAAIKLDPTLTHPLYDLDNAAMVGGIVRLAHDLSRSVIADGIDSSSQAREIRDLNCDYGQGNYFGKPMSEAQMKLLIQRVGAKPHSPLGW